MVHRYSQKGIVGLGALGRGIETLLPEMQNAQPAVIFFCVKAFDLEAALLEHQALWPENIPFVVLTNGYIWPIVERNISRFGDRPIRIGMTTIGSTIDQDDHVKVFKDQSMTAWGNWGEFRFYPCLKSESTLLQTCFPNGMWHDDIRPTIRQKWILNVVINTIAAANRLPNNGHLKKFETDVLHLLAEAMHLADRLWPNLDIPLQHDHLLETIWKVVQGTAGNENSMAKDVRLGRKTESEYLAGISLNFEGFPKLKKLHLAITKDTIDHR